MKVTEREKAVIFALAAGGIDTWEKAYLLSRNYSIEEAEQLKSIKPTVTRWKQRPDIATIYNNAIAVLKAKEDRIKEEARQTMKEEEGKEEEETGPADNNRTQGRRAAAVDYYNPENQCKTINAIIDRSADDPKTQLDAIKAIQQTKPTCHLQTMIHRFPEFQHPFSSPPSLQNPSPAE